MDTIFSSDSAIHVNIMIHRGGHTIVAYKAKPLFEGPRGFCMDKIRHLIDELSSQGNKQIVFHLQVMMAGDLNGMSDKGYYIRNLEQMNTSCGIEVKSGLYKV
ncbi:hypothetical protein [Barnesiella sp. An22]|uniref:hypothetical protein n=1 Tax=Barnesiella sp. An22 TaxID=1965590 RepID=UPI000B3A1DF6|nr:hypothetical protein [Barnesiella sp. An22]OUO99705.1 hypothetical protein B5F38_02475 [Barnesiella sp. An22]